MIPYAGLRMQSNGYKRKNMPRRRLRHVWGSSPERGISNIRQVARIEDWRDIFLKNGEKRHISWKMRE